MQEIDNHNKENNLFCITNPNIFCYLKSIDFSNDFTRAYIFLSTNFDNNLDLN